MKTTLELDAVLLTQAKALAMKRRTTLKAIVENALRREIQPAPALSPEQSKYMQVGPLGLLQLKKNGPAPTAESYRAMIEQDEAADDRQ